jgi:hypothetical protein
MTFFRRGRLSGRKARALLVELFDHHYQWPLRMPIVDLLERGDPLRFLCTLRFLIDRIGDGVYLLNQRQPPEQTPWFGDAPETSVAELEYRPVDLSERLMSVMCLDDPVVAELEVRRLLLEIVDLVPRDKNKGQKNKEQPAVSWLPRIADLKIRREPRDVPLADQADLRRIAQQAVRIVWRLPGSRLATLTGSVAAGYADLTSDIDITLFGLGLPKADVRRSLIAATSSAPKDITQLTGKTYAADAFWLKAGPSTSRPYLIDVRYFLIEEAQRLIEHPVPESPADEELLSDLSTADVLVDYEFRGPDLLHDLQQSTRRARSDRLARESAGVERAIADLKVSGDSASMFYATTDGVLALFRLLAARNDRWIVCPKRTLAWLEGLEHVPAYLHHRLSSAAMLPFRQENLSAKLETLRTLGNEIKAL